MKYKFLYIFLCTSIIFAFPNTIFKIKVLPGSEVERITLLSTITDNFLIITFNKFLASTVTTPPGTLPFNNFFLYLKAF